MKAYVVLTEQARLQDQHALTSTLQAHVRDALAPYQGPQDIEFIDALPMTTTGKVQRNVLRQRENDKTAAGS